MTLSGSRLQKLGSTVTVSVLCPDESCRATVSGSVRVPKIPAFKGKTYKLSAVTKPVARAQRTRIAIKLPATAVAAIRRALRARKTTSAELRIRVVDAAGNGRTATRVVRFKL